MKLAKESASSSLRVSGDISCGFSRVNLYVSEMSMVHLAIL